MPEKLTQLNDVFAEQDVNSFSSLHFANNPKTQLQAIVAINSTALGPALGGCRFVHYDSTNAAIQDALSLARGMTYKSAFNRVAFGGGKAVILMPTKLNDRISLMESYGDFINSLGGSFITAIDSGTNTDDMDIVSQRTKFVVCTSKLLAGTGDPSPYTARGVFRGIQAAIKKVYKRSSLEGIHVLIQGVGHVGYHLAQLLDEQGAILSVSDINEKANQRCQDEFSATVVKPDRVYRTSCDVLSPCALGQIINASTIERLNTRVIAGAANNQLCDDSFGEKLRSKNITYVPDFVINSGGLLQIAYINDNSKLNNSIENIYDSVLNILTLSEKQSKSTNLIAIEMAKKVLAEQQNDNTLSIVN